MDWEIFTRESVKNVVFEYVWRNDNQIDAIIEKHLTEWVLEAINVRDEFQNTLIQSFSRRIQAVIKCKYDII